MANVSAETAIKLNQMEAAVMSARTAARIVPRRLTIERSLLFMLSTELCNAADRFKPIAVDHTQV